MYQNLKIPSGQPTNKSNNSCPMHHFSCNMINNFYSQNTSSKMTRQSTATKTKKPIQLLL